MVRLISLAVFLMATTGFGAVSAAQLQAEINCHNSLMQLSTKFAAFRDIILQDTIISIPVGKNQVPLYWLNTHEGFREVFYIFSGGTNPMADLYVLPATTSTGLNADVIEALPESTGAPVYADVAVAVGYPYAMVNFLVDSTTGSTAPANPNPVALQPKNVLTSGDFMSDILSSIGGAIQSIPGSLLSLKASEKQVECESNQIVIQVLDTCKAVPQLADQIAETTAELALIQPGSCISGS